MALFNNLQIIDQIKAQRTMMIFAQIGKIFFIVPTNTAAIFKGHTQ